MVSCSPTWLMRLPAFALISLAALLQPAAEQRRVDEVIRCAQDASQPAMAISNPPLDGQQDGQEPDRSDSPDNKGPSLGPQPDIAWDRGAAAAACSVELRSMPQWQPEPLHGFGRSWHALLRLDHPSDLLDVNGHNANHPPHGPPPIRT